MYRYTIHLLDLCQILIIKDIKNEYDTDLDEQILFNILSLLF